MKSKQDKNGIIKINGTGFFGTLTIAFIVLKLCKVIDWAWYWVLSPLIINLLIVLIGLLIFFVYVKRWTKSSKINGGLQKWKKQ